jgi:uncharacterized membrane-anchored protein YhcB (DUF1043 family)
MTIERDNTVKLSIRDWTAIIAVVLTISGGVIGAFMHHDRLLMRLITQQENTNARLDKIERQLDAVR